MPVRTRWGAVAILILAGVIATAQIGKAAISLPVLQQDLSLTLVMAAWIVGAYALVGAAGGLLLGIATSVLMARTTLIAGLSVAGIGSLAGAFVDSGPALIATRVLEGGGSLAASLAIPRLLNAITAPQDRNAVLAVWGAHLPLGSVLMMLIGPSLLTVGWQSLWLLNGALALGYAGVIARLPVDEIAVPRSGVAVLSNIRAVITAPGPLLLALAFGVYTFQYIALAGLLPTMLVGRLGLSIAAAGAISAAAVAANAVGNMSAGILLRLGLPTWGIVAGAFLFVAAAGFGIFSDATPVALVAVLAAASLGLTGLIPGSIYAAAPGLAPSSALLAIALGLINQVTSLGNLCGPTAIAMIVERFGWGGAPFLFLTVGIVGLTAALLLRRVTRTAIITST